MTVQSVKKQRIISAWVNLVGEENIGKLRIDEKGYCNYECRKFITPILWCCLDSKIKPYKTKDPAGSDLLYRPKSLRTLC